MAKKLRELVIPKEKAAFRLDGRGRWHGEGGEFRHRKIIAHFHASIRKDRKGFHLMQRHHDYREKVYFPYEDTPLFVFDVLAGEDLEIVLNTGKRMKLTPTKLFIRGDYLYIRLGQDMAKFAEKALIRLSSFLEFEGDQAFIRVKGRRCRIPDEGRR